MNTPPIQQDIISAAVRTPADTRHLSLAAALADIFVNMDHSTCQKELTHLFDLMNRKLTERNIKTFTRNRQEDADEVLVQLLQLLHDELAPATTDMTKCSSVSDAFQCKIRSRLECPDCSCVGESDNYALSWKACLPLLPRTSEQSTQDCLNSFLSKEKLEWKCAQCGVSAMARRELTFVTTPKILVTQFVRFSSSGTKIMAHVRPNFEILLNNQKYRLTGIIHHEGPTAQSGHYAADVRRENGIRGETEWRWAYISDEKVQPYDYFVPKATATAYLAFYTRIEVTPSVVTSPSIVAAPGVVAAPSVVTVIGEVEYVEITSATSSYVAHASDIVAAEDLANSASTPKSASQLRDPLVCRYCGKTQSSTEALDRHIRDRGRCSAMTSEQRSELKAPTCCPACSYTTVTASAMTTHMRQQNHMTTPTSGIRGSFRGARDAQNCPFCNVSYVGLAYVLRHAFGCDKAPAGHRAICDRLLAEGASVKQIQTARGKSMSPVAASLASSDDDSVTLGTIDADAPRNPSPSV